MTTMTVEQMQFKSLLENEMFFFVDLEATCDDKGSVPREEMETIEVGFVIADHPSMRTYPDRLLVQNSLLIKPVRHPQLTPFCTQLTTISQAMVDEASSYEEVRHRVADVVDAANHMSKGKWLWMSWGEYDKYQLIQDAKFHGGEPMLPPENHINLKVWFSRLGYGWDKNRGLGLSKAVNKIGLTWQGGTPHRALPDALNVYAIFKKMREDFL